MKISVMVCISIFYIEMAAMPIGKAPLAEKYDHIWSQRTDGRAIAAPLDREFWNF
jgi:hypothetical protein